MFQNLNGLTEEQASTNGLHQLFQDFAEIYDVSPDKVLKDIRDHLKW